MNWCKAILIGFFLFSVFTAIQSRTARASPTQNPALLCDKAAKDVSDSSGVPVAVLLALTRTETGRAERQNLRPWPWTVNIEGHGMWFDTIEQAKSYTLKHFRAGKRSFDVGCFQVNYRWHGHAFSSLDEMFDPHENAAYAAKFLATLYAEFANWDKAVAAYHSRTPEHAEKYLERYAAIRGQLSKTPVANTQAEVLSKGLPSQRSAGKTLSSGSLVYLQTTGSRQPIVNMSSH